MDAKLSIETLCPDVIWLILDKLPCVERYSVYSLLCNEVKESIELLPRRLYLHCDRNGGVTCEEEGFGCFQVGLNPVVFRRNYHRWVEWSSSKGLVACIVAKKTLKQIVKHEELAIVVTNVVTGSTKSIEMPHLEKAVDVKIVDDFLGPMCINGVFVDALYINDVYVNIVLDHDSESKIYKIIIIEMEWSKYKYERHYTFHIYSSKTCEWQKHKKTIGISSVWITWHRVRSGFLHYSTHADFSYCLRVLDTTSMASFRVSDRMYNSLFILKGNFYIEIKRPVLFSDDNIVAFGRVNEHERILRLFKWEDRTRRWLQLSCASQDKLFEFVSKSAPKNLTRWVTATTFCWGRKVGMVLITNINYGLMYDMELDRWECISHPDVGRFSSAPWFRERSCHREHNNPLSLSPSLICT